MTYRNRMKKPRVKNLKESFPEGFLCPDHKAVNWKHSYADNSDPVTGKMIGWRDLSYKDRGLKKRIRSGARKEIHAQLIAMEAACPTCESEYCDNHKACKYEQDWADEQDALVWDQYMADCAERNHYEQDGHMDDGWDLYIDDELARDPYLDDYRDPWEDYDLEKGKENETD